MLAVNDVIEALADPADLDALSRVVWIDKSLDLLVLIALVEPPRQPFPIHLAQVEDWLRSGAAQKVTVRPPSYMLNDNPSAAAKATRDRNWARIAPLVAPGSGIFTPNALGALVSERARTLAVPRKTLYRLLYRYWINGQVPDALLPNYEQSGAPGRAKEFATGKRPGPAPRLQVESVEANRQALTEADKSCIRTGYALYKNNAVKSIQDAYIKTLRRFYAIERSVKGVTDDDVTLRPLHELPTLRQFRYWGQKAFDDLTVLRGRTGERRWKMNHRALTGRAGDGVRGPCHRFEIDATIADIYLVSRYNRNWIIGRPVVYVVVDVFTAMIVGVFVGLEGPSWAGARQAIYNAFSDKVAFCAEYGTTISPEDWPCHHLPQEIMADRGEMLGQQAEDSLVQGMGISIAIAPPFRPDWKAIVESRFRLLNQTSQIHWIPGAVRERVRERGERDYRLDATLDLAEFTQIILASVLHYNRFHNQTDRLTSDMIAAGMTSGTPLALWNWSMVAGIAEPKSLPYEAVLFHLLPNEAGSVRAGGIFFKGMYYVCDEAEHQQWFARARKSGVRSVRLWFDPNSTEHVWVRDRAGLLAPCRLRASEARYRERRVEEVVDMLAIVETTPPTAIYDELNSKVRLDAMIEGTIEQAAAEKRATAENISNAGKIADIRENRAREKAAIALERSPEHPAPTNRTPSTSSANDYAGERGGEVIDLLSRLRPGTKP
jgi:hypothetical protein